MSDILKIVVIFSLLFGAYKVFGNRDSAAPAKPRSTYSQGSSRPSGGKSSRKSSESVAAARANVERAQHELIAAQQSTAGTGTPHQEVRYSKGWKYTTSYTYDNRHVNERSARIKAAQDALYKAQLAYQQALRDAK